ncbi:MAG: (2Fe-2S)-binding protein [Ferrovibrio sp.]|nr:(2Fe-2S)-binding protein [Ferrovibrio sp.]MBP7065091.1 (2Fe-2S)-binding protein [Ferrovibrio sp.]
MPVTFTLNGKPVSLDIDPDMPLLWAVRDEVGLTGSKFGCGMAQCGACTMHVDNEPVRACSVPVGSIAGQKVTTIEGIKGKVAQAVQTAWVKHEVAQCGYCQSGQVMSAVALLSANQKPSDADIDEAMRGNICRCATYVRIRAAIHDAAKSVRA